MGELIINLIQEIEIDLLARERWPKSDKSLRWCTER